MGTWLGCDAEDWGVSLAPVDALSSQNANNGKVMRHFTFFFLVFFRVEARTGVRGRGAELSAVARETTKKRGYQVAKSHGSCFLS